MDAFCTCVSNRCRALTAGVAAYAEVLHRPVTACRPDTVRDIRGAAVSGPRLRFKGACMVLSAHVADDQCLHRRFCG